MADLAREIQQKIKLDFFSLASPPLDVIKRIKLSKSIKGISHLHQLVRHFSEPTVSYGLTVFILTKHMSVVTNPYWRGALSPLNDTNENAKIRLSQ